ncbi:hypothetical protein Cpir12675_003554 [Ceratocystis pirilliformis]|uniref:Uncharacterized protein n=1 Tax=Ceratocystis pirilliformis TaxID=259994 RepID=A0ABR3Z295_9PEZI
MPSIPGINQVVRGALVNIVLKADQPTGRTVAGVIQDVLTRGNHPRGIKVRLVDGRVGRVKSLASETQARGDEPSTPAEPGDFGIAARQVVRGRDVRHGSGLDLAGDTGAPATEIGLDAYIRPAKGRGKGRGGAGQFGQSQRGYATDALQSTDRGEEAPVSGAAEKINLSVCPVCHVFEGDEQAVSHHVGTHFE